MLRRLLFLSTITLSTSDDPFSSFPIPANVKWIASAYEFNDEGRLFIESFKDIARSNNSTKNKPIQTDGTDCLRFELKLTRKQFSCRFSGLSYLAPSYNLKRLNVNNSVDTIRDIPVFRYKEYDFVNALQTIQCYDEDDPTVASVSNVVLVKNIDSSLDHFLMVVVMVPPWFTMMVGSEELVHPPPKLHPYIVTKKIYTQEKLNGLVNAVNGQAFPNMPKIVAKCFSLGSKF